MWLRRDLSVKSRTSLPSMRIAPEDLVAYLLYVQTLLTTIRRFVEFSEQFQRGITGFERFD